MIFLKETEDSRGKIAWFEDKEKEIHLVEMKKGFARGGHYHPFASTHVILAGKILYKYYNLTTEREEERVVGPFSVLNTPQDVAHLFVALEDSIFVEVFEGEYDAVEYTPYRQIVNESMQK